MIFQRVEYSGRVCRCILCTVVHNVIGIILFITIIDAMTFCTTGSNYELQIVNDSIRGSTNKMFELRKLFLYSCTIMYHI